jgi:hypothetical protein
MPEPKRTIVLHSFGLYGHEELSIDELCERFDMGQDEMRGLLQEGERELARHVGEGS